MRFGKIGARVAAVVCAGAAFVLLLAAGKSDFNIGRSMDVLLSIFREVSVHYVEQTDPNELLKNAAKGMTGGLDPYTEFLSEEDMDDFQLLTTGKYGGIGSLIRQKGDWVYIAEPYQGRPADLAGLRIGDKILAVDTVNAEGIGSERVSALLKGDPGTTVKVRVEQGATGKAATMEIKRERIAISGVPYYGFVSDSIGYIVHNDFTEDCSSDMRRALMELKNTGRLKGLILDYRGNGGGILQEAVKILSLFVPRGTDVVSMKGRYEESNAVFVTESEPVAPDLPIAVLVNSGSASAAEIVAGALQDLDRGVLVGQRTFGKGLVQSTIPVGYNSYLKVTTAKYYIPSGRCIQAIDYAHRNEDGSVSHVPDSLAREYKTANGRAVYDGGGVMPDIQLAPQYVSRFTMLTYGMGYVDDFADLYVKRHPTSADPLAFTLSTADYRWFTEFMEDKKVEYRSETARTLEALKKSAERELYLEGIKEYIDKIEQGIKDDKKASLELYRDQITDLLESAVVLRYGYRKAVIEHGMRGDEGVESAVELLKDHSRYQHIVTTQAPPRR